MKDFRGFLLPRVFSNPKTLYNLKGKEEGKEKFLY